MRAACGFIENILEVRANFKPGPTEMGKALPELFADYVPGMIQNRTGTLFPALYWYRASGTLVLRRGPYRTI